MGIEESFWDEPSLWAKTRAYIEIAQEHDRQSWQFPFWLTLALEHLGRTALSHIHPSLLAGIDQEGRNLLYALKLPILGSQHTPKSIDARHVYKRCGELVPGFNADHVKFCTSMASFRNEELHSGGTPFLQIKVSDWQSRLYAASEILVVSMQKELVDLLGKREGHLATAMVKEWKNESGKQALRAIETFKKLWKEKSEQEHQVAREKSVLWANRNEGHVVECPSCGCDALVFGQGIAEPRATGGDDKIEIKTDMVPTRFRCVACDLRITSYNQLLHVGLGQLFTATEQVDPVEYYGFLEMVGYEGPDQEPDYND